MKIITANLKLLYQNREMWAWYFIFGLSILHILSSLPPPPPSAYTPLIDWDLISPVLILTVFGCALGRLTADMWTKPLFFCIPGQTRTCRNILFLMGLVTTIIAFCIITNLPSWMTFRSPEVTIALFSFYLMIHCLSVIISVRFYKIIFFIPYFVLFLMPIMGSIEILGSIQRILLTHPWISAFVSLIINFAVYHVLGSRYLIRSVSGAPSVTFFVAQEVSGSNGYAAARAKYPHIQNFTKSINHIFYKLIKSNNSLPLSSHTWGKIYIILGSFFANWKIIFFDGPVIFLSVASLIRTFQFIEIQFYLFIFISLLSGHICVLSESDVFLPLDRRDRFFSQITTLIISLFIMLVLAALFELLSRILPLSVISFLRLTGSTGLISFHPKYIFLTIILLPITGGLLILFQKKSFISILLITGMAILLLGANYHMIDDAGHMFNFSISNILIVIPSIILSFGFYLAVIYYDSFKRSLS